MLPKIQIHDCDRPSRILKCPIVLNMFLTNTEYSILKISKSRKIKLNTIFVGLQYKYTFYKAISTLKKVLHYTGGNTNIAALKAQLFEHFCGEVPFA